MLPPHASVATNETLHHTHTYLFLITINNHRLQIEYQLKNLRSRLRAVYIFIQNDVLAYAPLLFLQGPLWGRGSRLRAVYIFI